MEQLDKAVELINEAKAEIDKNNTGDWNTGDWNTGDWNTGNRNTGNRNTGDWNTGNCNTGGYLKVFDYKEAFTKSVTEASKEDRDLIRALPNFNADIFLEISGVDLRLLDTNEI